MAYTDQREFDKRFEGTMLTVKVNSGELKIEALHDEDADEWVEVQTITEDFGGVIEGLGILTLRFTPANGATYMVW